MEEKIVWKGNSSQVVNAGLYAACAVGSFLIFAAAFLVWMPILGLLLLPGAYAAWKWIENQSRVFEVTTQRVKVTTGILSKRTEELELYRVKDTATVEPLLQRMVGAGNIVLNTNDETTPVVTIVAVKKVAALREEIRKNVEICRDQKRVRLAELE